MYCHINICPISPSKIPNSSEFHNTLGPKGLRQVPVSLNFCKGENRTSLTRRQTVRWLQRFQPPRPSRKALSSRETGLPLQETLPEEQNSPVSLSKWATCVFPYQLWTRSVGLNKLYKATPRVREGIRLILARGLPESEEDYQCRLGSIFQCRKPMSVN